jgi:carbon storage regulator
MLVLSRKVGERILIGDRIAVTVVRVGPGIVRLGIEAPSEMPVVREELRSGESQKVAAFSAQSDDGPWRDRV